MVPLKDCTVGFSFSVLGGALGTLAVQQFNRAFLLHAIPFMLVAVAVFMFFKPRLGETDVRSRMQRRVFDFSFGLVIGFYDGFLGPGTGTFWTMAYMLALGFNLTRATGYTKVMNFGSNLSSLIFFLIGGKVLFVAGLLMGFGQLLGARAGSRMVLAKGTKFIRPVFLTVVLVLTLKLIYENYFG